METLAARRYLGSVGVSVGDGSVIRIDVMRTGRTGCPNKNFPISVLKVKKFFLKTNMGAFFGNRLLIKISIEKSKQNKR